MSKRIRASGTETVGDDFVGSPYVVGATVVGFADGEKPRRPLRLGRNVPQTQANVFASNLLMPATQFEAAFKELRHDLVAVARRFEVSYPAAKVRADFLGLLT